MSATDLSDGRGARSAASFPTAGLQPGERVTLPWPALIYVVCVVTPIWFKVGPLSMSTLRLFLMFMIVPLLVRIFMGKYGKVLWVEVFFVLHMLWAALAFSVVNPDRLVEQLGAISIEVLGGYAVGRAYIRSSAQFEALCRTLVWISCIFLPFATFEAMTGRPLLLEIIRSIPGAYTFEFNYQDKRLNMERVQLTFAHPIHSGLFFAIVLPLAMVGLRHRVTELRRYVTSGIVGICGFLALSSGALLAIVLQVALICWAYLFRNVKHHWRYLVGFGVFSYVVVDLLSNRTPLQVFLSYATFSPHTAYWRMLILEWGLANIFGSVEKGITGQPWFGYGMASQWERPSFMHSPSMDNFWLVVAFRYGVPSFVFLAIGYTYGIARVMMRDFSNSLVLTMQRRAWVFVFLGMTFTLSTVYVWTNVYSFIFFMYGAGMWLITAEADTPRAEEAEPEPARTANRFTRFPDGAPSTRTRQAVRGS
ncbi:MAG: O-antigen ligase family protein [Pseudooceanicola nanhaiensis]